MTGILVTGFGRFPGAPFNPSAQIVARLSRIRRPALSQHVIATQVLPVSYAAVDRDLPVLIKRHKPRIVIMFGLAARTKFLRVEMLAHNRQSRLFPDGERHIPTSYRIRPGAPESLRGRAPFAPLVSAARAAGVDVRLSRDAGRYICNYVYWRALEAAAKAGGPGLVVFVHVPELRSNFSRQSRGRRPTLAQAVGAAANLIIAANAGLARR